MASAAQLSSGDRFDAADLLTRIGNAEIDAHRLGFHVAGHALNRAKNALGWELAGDVEQAGKAGRDERPER